VVFDDSLKGKGDDDFNLGKPKVYPLLIRLQRLFCIDVQLEFPSEKKASLGAVHRGRLF
jgi:hypothetical protein